MPRGSRNSNGYLYARFEGRKRGLHRWIVERILGRSLLRSEHVHHVDGNKTNNHPDNLRVLSASEHAFMSKRQHPLLLTCAWCGRPFLNAHSLPGTQPACCCLRCAAYYRHHRPKATARALPDPIT